MLLSPVCILRAPMWRTSARPPHLDVQTPPKPEEWPAPKAGGVASRQSKCRRGQKQAVASATRRPNPASARPIAARGNGQCHAAAHADPGPRRRQRQGPRVKNALAELQMRCF